MLGGGGGGGSCVLIGQNTFSVFFRVFFKFLCFLSFCGVCPFLLAMPREKVPTQSLSFGMPINNEILLLQT